MIAHDSNDSNDAMFFSSIEKVLSGYQRRQALCNAPHMIHKTKKVFLVYVNNRRVTAGPRVMVGEPWEESGRI